MGNPRLDVQLQIGGHIASAEAMYAVVEFISEQTGHLAQSVRNSLLIARNSGKPAEFEILEVSWGQLDGLSSLEELGLDWSYWHGQEFDIDATTYSHNGQTGERFEWAERDADHVDSSAIEKVLNNGDSPVSQVAEIAELIKEGKAQMWEDVRPLTIAEDLAEQERDIWRSHFDAWAAWTPTLPMLADEFRPVEA